MPETPSPLFTPLSLGGRRLNHRVVMAPMTRTRADEASLAPDALTALYYGQRASEGGLLITEAVHISPEATPIWTIYAAVRAQGGHVPGIWTQDQIEGWRAAVAAVHAKGGFISCQLLHAGRIAQPEIGAHPLVKGTGAPLPPVSSSAAALRPGEDSGDYNWDQPARPPRALTRGDIARVIEDYRTAARNADRAGFDFVEIHAAHGYLIEQFMCDGINARTDEYGGNIENRCRFLFEVTAALTEELGEGRVGVRLSPTSVNPETGKPYQTYFGAFSSDADALYAHAAAGLNAFPLAYLMLTEPRVGGLSAAADDGAPTAEPLRNLHLRRLYHGVLIGAGGFTPKSAPAAAAQGAYDMIAFGRWFLSNPDLPERLRAGAPLNVYDRETFYGRSPQGYTDYPDQNHIGDPRFGAYPLMEQRQIGVSLAAAGRRKT